MNTQTDFDNNGEAAIIDRCIRDGDVVFDVGAHLGDWSAAVLKTRRPAALHLFEAAPACVERLRAREFGAEGRLTVEASAVGAGEGEVSFNYYTDAPAWSGIYRREEAEKRYNKQAPQSSTVPMTTLDAYCTRHGIRHVNFIKIDVEGAELDVIHGAWELLSRGAVDHIQFEYGGTYADAGTTLRQVYSYLRRFGYEIFRIEASGPERMAGFDAALEDYEYSNYLAVNARLLDLFLGTPPRMPGLGEWLGRHGIEPRGVIHVGGHEGQEVDAYARLGIEHALFFEANPQVFDTLQARLAERDGYQALHCAIVESNAPVTLRVTSFDQSSSVLPLKEHARIYPDIVEVAQVEVPGRRLDDILRESGDESRHYNLLSLDIQGAELLALKGAVETLHQVDAIRVEVNYAELYAGGAHVYELDAFLDAQGFARVETACPFHPSWGDAFYVRKPRVAMSSLGSNGRFANQIFQYAFLKIHAREHHLRVETPAWIGQRLFGAEDAPLGEALPEVRQATQDARECQIFNAEQVYRNVDFWGYFQYHTRHYVHHRDYFRSLFRPHGAIADELYSAVARLRAGGRTLVGLHLRRGDYGYGDFYITPAQWYRQWLAQIWPTLEAPLLYIASDEPEAVLKEFADYAPLSAADLGIAPQAVPAEAGFYTDFYLLSQCDRVAISNSSFSFAACLLNTRGAEFMRPDVHAGRLMSFDPWHSEVLQRDVCAEELGPEFFSQRAIDAQKAAGRYRRKETVMTAQQDRTAGGEPRISVCISSYRQKAWLAQALDSVLGQTRLPDEIIVVDDASDDGSAELIQDYVARYPQLIRVKRLERNSGIVAVRNTALAMVTGDYVSFLDGDDRFLPEKIDTEYRCLQQQPEADFVYARHAFIDERGVHTGLWSGPAVLPEGDILAAVYARDFPGHSLFRNELVRVELARKLDGYDSALSLYEDYEFRIRLAARGRAAYCDAVLSEYRRHGGGLSRAAVRRHLDALAYITHKHYPTLLRLDAAQRVAAMERLEQWVESVFVRPLEAEIAQSAGAATLGAVNASAGASANASAIGKEGEGLIFLISQPRAGSTLLQRLITGDAEVLSVAEPWIMLPLLSALRGGDAQSAYDAELARQGMEDFLALVPGGEQRYREAIRDVAVALYRDAVTAADKRRFLDKTPRYHHVLDELVTMFPKAQFVFLMRNPLAVFASTLKTWFAGNPAQMLASTHRDDLYLAPQRMLDAIARLGERAIVVHYEDVVTRPEATLRQLFARLDLRYDTQVPAYAARQAPPGRFGDNVSIDTHGGPVADHLGAWRQTLIQAGATQVAQSYLQALGREVCEHMGYGYDDLLAMLDPAAEGSDAAGFAAESAGVVPVNGDTAQLHAQADVLTRQGEQFFEQGEVELAIAKFEEALRLDPGFVTALNNLGVVHYARGDYVNAAACFARALAADPADENARANLQALQPYLDASGPATSGTDVGMAGTDAGAATALKIVTSIAPRGLDNQRRAVNSWLALGFRVVSLNCAEEIAQLAPLFPEVEFVAVQRDGRALSGRPLVYFDDILQYYRDSGDTICGIVNSDILLKQDMDFCAIIRDEAAQSLVYGSRVDVTSFDSLSGGVYRGGFDFFFFSRDFLDAYPPSDFMLGMTWWDYWVPTVALLRGLPVKRLDTYFAFHEHHAANYSPESYVQFGKAFIAQVLALVPDEAAILFPALQTWPTVDVSMFGSNVTKFLIRYSRPLTLPVYQAAPLNEEGERLFALGDQDGALQAFERALQVHPEDVRALNNIAVLSWQLGERETAWACATRAYELDAQDRTAVMNYIEMALVLGLAQQAQEACAQYLAAHPGDGEMLALAGQLGVAEASGAAHGTSGARHFSGV